MATGLATVVIGGGVNSACCVPSRIMAVRSLTIVVRRNSGVGASGEHGGRRSLMASPDGGSLPSTRSTA